MRRTAALDPAGEPDRRKRTRIGFWAPATIIGFIALTLVGSYYVRLFLHERAMSLALRMNDNTMITELAFSWPCPVNASDNEAGTPLHWAAREGRRDLAERLLAKGADVNAKDTDGGTPLHWAAEGGHKEIVDLLLAKGADVRATDTGGWTPLHWTALIGRKDIAEVLIAQGAAVNAKDGIG